MKRNADLLLLVPLVLAIVYVVMTFRNDTTNELFVSSSLAPIDFAPKNSTPIIAPSVVPPGSFTPLPTRSASLTPSPSSTVTLTSTNTSTSTASPTNTVTSTSIPTSTPTVTPESQEVTSGITAGNEIVQAIESYYVHEGHYPATLNDLIPAYFSQLPTTPTGQPYIYRFFEPTHPMASDVYWLSFRVVEQQSTICTYLRRLQYWDCNIASP